MTAVTVRDSRRNEGDALASLYRQSPDTGRVQFAPDFRRSPLDTFDAQGDPYDLVVAEADDRIVGAGVVSFHRVRLGGDPTDAAYLHSLAVHPDYRRAGVATRLAAARVERARDRFGDDGVVYAHIQSGNTGSQRVAESWARERSHEITTVPVDVREEPPNTGYEIRRLGADGCGAFAERANSFYRDHEFSAPTSKSDLTAFRERGATGARTRHVYGAFDGDDLVAGALFAETFREMRLDLVSVSRLMRLADRAFGFLPRDGVMRLVTSGTPWFADGHAAAFRALLDRARYDYRDDATNVLVRADAHGPVIGALDVSRFTPSTTTEVAYDAPEPLDPERRVGVVPTI